MDPDPSWHIAPLIARATMCQRRSQALFLGRGSRTTNRSSSRLRELFSASGILLVDLALLRHIPVFSAPGVLFEPASAIAVSARTATLASAPPVRTLALEISEPVLGLEARREPCVRLDHSFAIVAEVEIGLGPLHTAFDGRGNAYTTLFLDSQVVKWNVEAAIKFHAGDKTAKYVVDRLDVQYQPGHLNASHSETKAADGKFLAVGCKFSKDRFLPAGPLHPENEQLIDISGEKMVLLADHPVRGEPHDFIIFKRDLVRPKQVYSHDDFPLAIRDPKESGVFRNGKKVTVKITSQAPAFSLREFKLKKGDEVTLILTNLDKIEDLTHGFAIPNYNVNFIVNPLETKSVTFIADKPGVFWCYCTHFCHALHLEMRTRMIVEA